MSVASPRTAALPFRHRTRSTRRKGWLLMLMHSSWEQGAVDDVIFA
jgi:hypothetical protein